MSDDPQEIQTLRQALAFSPENTALRMHFADTLIKYGRFAEAEAEYKEGLRFAPNETAIMEGLARVYAQQEKRSEAFVLLESLEKSGTLSPSGRLTYARLLARTTELVKAAAVYRALKEAHPELADPGLEEELAPFLIDYAYDDPDDPRRVPAGEHPGTSEPDAEHPKITFADVGGMDAVKERIRMKVIYPQQNAELFKAYGKRLGGGLLLYGPPGCGKTYLARATAGEVRARFYAIGLHDVLDMWIGQSEKNLHEIFQVARAQAPSVLFFDEVDALGASRSDMRQSAARHAINQFLNELDGATHSNDGVFVLAATNTPWHLDSAFRRPGRFDDILFVPPPDAPAREAILRVLLANKPVDDIDYRALAARTEGFSGADLKSAVERAIEATLDASMKKGRILQLNTKDLTNACKATRPSTKEWFATARNHALYSNQSGVYDDILEYLKITK